MLRTFGPSHRRLIVIAAALCAAAFAGCASRSGRRGVSSRGGHLTSGDQLEQEGRTQPRAIGRVVYPPGLALTKTSEGWSARLYNDAARYCTIGYGHLVQKAPCNGAEPPMFLAGLTEPQGEELLVADMAHAEGTVSASVAHSISDGQFAALSDFVFNVGSANFRASTLLQVVNARQYEKVPSQLRRWVYSGGKPWPGLQTRREREIALFFDGQLQPRAAPPATEDLSPIDIRAGEKRP
jgi:GH24 family phage-related lysozyme (muramidase)